MVKHGCRTLLKQADTDVLTLFGFSSKKLEFTNFVIRTPGVNLGDSLKFSFSVKNIDRVSRSLRLEYALYFRKKNGSLLKKVFKISERKITPGEHLSIVRKQSFRPISTRTYYPGEHKISVIVNGNESTPKSFEVI